MIIIPLKENRTAFRGIFVEVREYLNPSFISLDIEYLELLGINIVL